MGEQVAVLESQITQLATMRSELDDSMKVDVLIATLKDNSRCEPLIASTNFMNEEEATWRQNFVPFIKEAKDLNGKAESNSQRRENQTARLA